MPWRLLARREAASQIESGDVPGLVRVDLTLTGYAFAQVGRTAGERATFGPSAQLL